VGKLVFKFQKPLDVSGKPCRSQMDYHSAKLFNLHVTVNSHNLLHPQLTNNVPICPTVRFIWWLHPHTVI